MSLRWVLPLTAVLLAVAGCGSSNSNSSTSSGVSSSVSCVNDVCRIDITGDPSGTRLGVLGRSLRVLRMDVDGVTVDLAGEEVTIPAGGTETVGGLRVRVVEAGDRKAKLEVHRG